MDLGDLQCIAGTIDDMRVYNEARIPNPRDVAIVSLIEKAAENGQLQDLVDAIRPRHDPYFLNLYSRRMATLAVRRGDKGYIRSGLLALSVAHQKTVPTGTRSTTCCATWRRPTARYPPDFRPEFRFLDGQGCSTSVASWRGACPACAW